MVAEEVKLLEDLNNMWIGSYKIRAFLPRYGRKSPEIKSFEAHRNVRVPTISYAEVTAVTLKTNGETTVSIPRAETEDKAWLKECITGTLKKNFSWEEYQDEIQTKGGGSLLLRSLGEDVFLIQNLTGKPYEILMKEWDDWFLHWFEWHRPWRPTDVSKKRLVWTRWYGVPSHAWNSKFFETVCVSLGPLVKIDENTLSRKRLDVARIMLSVSYLKEINQVFKLNIDGTKFSIRVMEEFDWPLDESSDDLEDDSEEGDNSQWSEDEKELRSLRPAAATQNDRTDRADDDLSDSDSVGQCTRSHIVSRKKVGGVGSTGKSQGTDINVNSTPKENNHEYGKTNMETRIVDPSEEMEQLIPEKVDLIRGISSEAPMLEKSDRLDTPTLNGPSISGPKDTHTSNGPILSGPMLRNETTGPMHTENSQISQTQSQHLMPRKETSTKIMILSKKSSNPSTFLSTSSVGRCPPLLPKPQGQSKKQKSNRGLDKMQVTAAWQSFVKNIESEEEREAEARDLRIKNRKELLNSKHSVNGAFEEARKTWQLGKELGLTTKQSDSEIIEVIMSLDNQKQDVASKDKEMAENDSK
ncbi:hypothetical protein ACS0TY_031578 [Phlomoides rotata]